MRNVQKLKDNNIYFRKFSNYLRKSTNNVLLVRKILEIVEEHNKKEKVINITEKTKKVTNFSYK